MRLFRLSGVALAGLAWAALTAASASEPDPTGAEADASSEIFNHVWVTADGRAHIRFEPCGEDELCGALEWIRNQEIHPDPILIDKNNPDEALRGRPLLGARILSGFKREGEVWRDGAIYRPKNGKTYRANITELGDGMIEVEGCLLLFCRAQVWMRIDMIRDTATLDAATAL